MIPNALHWLLPTTAQSLWNRTPTSDQPVHLLLAICDHFEPQHGKPSPDQATKRVRQWTENFPKLFANFRDSDNRPPQHTFFFPIDEYDPHHIDSIAALCRNRNPRSPKTSAAETFGEIETHHHHDNDTPSALHDRLLLYVDLFQNRHGLLPRDKTGRTRYAFIHGNWALNNSRPDRRWCGINNEIKILRDTGCYADFTFPSAPSNTQPRTINRIYYARGDEHHPKGHNTGTPVGQVTRASCPHPPMAPPSSAPTSPAPAISSQPADTLMLITGPLLLNWHNRKFGLLPRVENACLQHNQLPTMRRLNLWLKARIQIPQRPDWFFVKLHTHGAPEKNANMLLGQPMIDFHQSLATRAAADKNFHYHYVTAREMYNLAKAAESNYPGPVNNARNFELDFP